MSLAHEDEFLLGCGIVLPSLLQFRTHDAVRSIQPRVMQTLVLLGRRPGQVVTREDLIGKCWAGRVVGRDAVERCVGILRRLGAVTGAFSIETIPRVGYRLRPNAAVRVDADSGAYDLYLRGMQLSLRATLDDFRHAEQLFTEAVARAPGFALAWAGLASTRAALLDDVAHAPEAPEYRAASAAVNRALALDSGCTMAYRVQALLKPPFGAYAEKLALARRALLEAPDEPFSLLMMAGALGSVGRGFEGLPFALRAVELEPSSPLAVASAADLLDRCGRGRAARRLILRARKRIPSSPWIELAWRALVDTPRRPWRTIASPTVESELVHSLRREGPLPLPICIEAAQRGLGDLAYERLFDAIDRGRPIVVPGDTRSGGNRAFITSRLFAAGAAALRRDVRFTRLCAKVGLVDHWLESGCWPDCEEDPTLKYHFRSECLRARS